MTVHASIRNSHACTKHHDGLSCGVSVPEMSGKDMLCVVYNGGSQSPCAYSLATKGIFHATCISKRYTAARVHVCDKSLKRSVAFAFAPLGNGTSNKSQVCAESPAR